MPKPGKGGGNGGGDSGIIGNKRDNNLLGSDAAEVIDGKAGNDTLTALGGNDTLIGGDGNDILDGGLGDDSVDGGAGTDTAILTGNRDDYQVTDLGGGLIEISGPDGTDTFTNVELFSFADMTQTATEVLVPRLANLTAQSLLVYDTSLTPGEGTGMSIHIASNGTIDASETTFELLLASSPDEASVISVLDTQTALPIVTGDTDVYSATIPADTLAPGSYWVAIRVDAGNALTEENENDNLTEWVQIVVEEPVTDLRLTSATINAATDTDLGYGGGQIWVDYAIENVGNTGSGGFKVVAFLSQDGTISVDDILIGETSGNLFPGGGATGQVYGSIAENTPDGDWQVLTAIEWTGGEIEATPADNVIANSVTLTPALADLQLNAATLGVNTDLDLSGGGRLEMTYDWANAGTTSPSYFAIRSYLSTDDQISADDQQILGITGGTFLGQVSSSTTSHYFAPDFTPGDYYLISEIVWGDGTSDATAADNTLIQQVTFAPAPYDLAITNVTMNASTDLVLDDDGIWLSYNVDVANVGEIAGSAPVTAYLSTDNSITADDIRIDAGTVTLAPVNAQIVPIGVQLDSTLSAGDYTLIVTLAAPDDYAGNSIFYVDLTLEDPAQPPAITGTEGNDTLTGTAGDDIVNALGGDDVVIATTGFDVTDGGTGYDTADFSTLSQGLLLQPDFAMPGTLESLNQVTYGREQTFSNFEAIIATAHDDLIAIADTGIRFIDLGAGNDVAMGSDFDDVILAGSGNDSISGGDGDDTVTLGDGADLFGVTRFDVAPFPSGDGNDVVTDFDITEDMLYFQIVNGTTYDPLADTVQTAQGAMINYIDGSSILLEGVNAADLTSDHFIFEDTIYPVPA